MNSLFHRTDYKYDLGTGNLLWGFSNNINKTYDTHIIEISANRDNLEKSEKPRWDIFAF